ncbi:unnamed protein product [Rotaria sp. Silwood1]|nr:unnamed protein product [Rotaria sp. Silwood1]CAF1612122.1 unnamed protein product [Rotaria sp. Silwood1]CAF3730736.1 unnamed protein product [Rotaria sp. Silwood1]CAF4518560.1 unnamed protein product [Rotaria sp. Silwood1]CAF4818785.1 unnamed protein product [Rotaria sp. Silwood1]
MNIENDVDKEVVPEYLSLTNGSFKATFVSEFYRTYNPIDGTDLQCLAILTHKLTIINYYRKLWNVYLKCGTRLFNERNALKESQQETINQSLCIWPYPVTSLMIAQRYNDIIDEKEITYDMYVNFIKKNLFQFDTQAAHFEKQFNVTKDHMDTFSCELTYKIDDYVRKNDQITAMRLHFEARIDLAEYVYLDQVLQLKYLHQKPNEDQIKLAQHIARLQLQKEKSEQELILFKFGVLYKKLPESLNALEEILPTSITTIMNTVLRERLSSNYIRIIQRTKADLMMILTTAAEIQNEQHQNAFNTFMAQMWNDQRKLPKNEQLNPTMLLLIDDRQKNILACTKHIYSLKTNYYTKI